MEKKKYKKIVVKIGTNSLTNVDGALDLFKMQNLVNQIVQLINQGIEIVLVTSGAVGCGKERLGLDIVSNMAIKQASAAVGQVQLMKMYDQLFSENNKVIAQILLTKDDMTHRDRHLNAKRTLQALVEMGVVAIINENDTTVVDEIKVGDNDNLSALVAILVEADALILLSDIDGLYTDNPSLPHAKKLAFVDEIDDTILSYAKGKGSKHATGGMLTKLEAAIKVTSAGIDMFIANASEKDILNKLISFEQIGTLFLGHDRHLSSRKKWLLLFPQAKGVIHIDKGAKEALMHHGSSLLMVGINKMDGHFNAGDVILIMSENEMVARGVVKYDQQFIESALYQHADLGVIVHRDQLVLIEEGI